jgi:hypothetical protein
VQKQCAMFGTFLLQCHRWVVTVHAAFIPELLLKESQHAASLPFRCLEEVLTSHRAYEGILPHPLVAKAYRELGAVFVEAKQYVSV